MSDLPSSLTAPAEGPAPMPCGTWPSRVTAALVAGKTLSLSEVNTDGNAVFWLERRPAEKGRSVLMRWTQGQRATEALPAQCDVATRVHEYGGGAYAVRGGCIAFSDKKTGSVWLVPQEGAQPVQIAGEDGLRYADLRFDPTATTVLAVREDHRAEGEAKAALVALKMPVGAARAQEGVLYNGPDFLSSPAVSPDGTRMAWVEWQHPDMPWDATRLCLADVERDAEGRITALRNRQVLTGATQRESVLEPRWTENGTLLAISDRSGCWTLWRVQADHTPPSLVPCTMPEGEIGQPAWVFGQRSYQPLPEGGCVVLAVRDGRTNCLIQPAQGQALPCAAHPDQCPVPLADGRFAWLEVPEDALPAVVVGSMTHGAEQVLQRAATLDLAPADIARAETVRFPVPGLEGASGHALFYPPANSRACVPEGTLPPMIVQVHGGPTARANEGFSFKVQWWTSRGFAVLDVNYGGSTGFGRAWRERLNGAWGVVDVADCLAACRHMVATGRVDPKRLAIRGSSAGGMTVLVALAESDLFAAGVSLYGVTDLRALAQETHKFEARYLDGLIGPWPEAEAVYLARSPLSVAHKIKAAVLLLQGADDKVVPPGQAHAMARALEEAGSPCTLHEFPGEGHGFRQEVTIRKALEEELAFYGRVFGF
ncbi:S9 family peptidase [Acetobacter orleanensis]|nr:prolyl oligopeptidase family serine peptidase [Acetobacter orleanensis]KXV63059.1 peptidase S9 [Acetobacter orleanensis]PCD79514.1 S9 family peptidase [Acetobacter orleanensis]